MGKTNEKLEQPLEYGTLFKKDDKWFIEPRKKFKVDQVDPYQLHPSSILFDEQKTDIEYGMFKFYLDSDNYAYLEKPLKVDLDALQDYRMEYVTLMLLSAFFKQGSQHYGYTYIQTRLEHILTFCSYSDLPPRQEFRDIKIEYKTLNFVRNLFPKNSKLKCAHYIDTQMEFLIYRHFLGSKD